MYWRVSVAGDIEFPQGGIERWRRLPIDYAALGGWPREGHFAKGEAPSKTVEEALDRITHLPGAPLAIEPTGVVVRFSGSLDKDLLADVDRDLGAVIRLAADAGARGEVLVLEELGSFAYRFTVGDGKSSFKELRPREIDAWLAEHAAPLASPPERARAASKPSSRQPRAAASPPMWGPSTFSPEAARIHHRICDALERANPGSIAEAARRAGGELLVQLQSGKLEPLFEVLPDEAAIRGALRAGSDLLDLSHEGVRDAWFFEVGLSLLAQVDIRAAEVVAKDAVAEAPVYSTIRTTAVRILGKSDSDAATTALLGLLTSDDGNAPDAGDAAQALAASPNPRVGERVLSLLSDDAMATKPARFMLDRYVLEILGAKRYAPATGRLLEIWRAGKEKNLRAFAGDALLAIGSPDALKGLTSIKQRLESSYANESSTFLQALFLTDPAHAYDQLAPYLSDDALMSKKGEAIARRAFSVLANREEAARNQPSNDRHGGWIEVDPRWVDLGLRLLPRDTDATDVLRLVPFSKDARVLPALLGLFGQVDTSYVCAALRAHGNPAAVPDLEKRLRRMKKADERRVLEELIAYLRSRDA